MASDLRAEFGIDDAGLGQLLAAMTAPAEPAELASEQAALAMFRARAGREPGVAGADSSPAAPDQLQTRPIRLRRPPRWNIRLAAAAAVVLVGGMAAAAYAAALPAPVQHLVHDVFQFAGVPDSQPGIRPAGPGGRSSPGSHHPAAPGASATPPGQSSPGVTGSPGASPGAAGAALSAAAASTRITAGTSVVISGQLSWPGHSVGGVTMTLLERPALTSGWQVVGSVPLTADGNGSVTVPVVSTNAVFRLAVPGVVVSADVRVTVVPAVTLALNAGSGGKADVVTVSVPYAQAGDVVVLQVSSAGGSWTYLRQGTLTVLHRVTFVLDATRLGSEQIRAVLLPTGRHAGSVSTPVTVPPPS